MGFSFINITGKARKRLRTYCSIRNTNKGNCIKHSRIKIIKSETLAEFENRFNEFMFFNRREVELVEIRQLNSNVPWTFMIIYNIVSDTLECVNTED